MNPMNVIMKIMEAEAPKLEGNMWSDCFKDIIAQMLKKESHERPTCKNLLDNADTNFLRKARDAAYMRGYLL